MLIAFLASAALTSCEKKEVVSTEEPSDLEKLKLQKIKRFISIMWEVPLAEVLFNEEKKEFTFGNITMAKDEIEKVYDVSNEYKFNYERD
jgi:hypothetical protein